MVGFIMRVPEGRPPAPSGPCSLEDLRVQTAHSGGAHIGVGPDVTAGATVRMEKRHLSK